MKLKSFHILVLVLLSTLNVKAQIDPTNLLVWGETESKSGYLVEMLPFHGKDFYSLHWKGNAILSSYFLCRHDDLAITNTAKVSKSVNNSIANFENVAIINEHPSIFLSDKKEGQDQLYLQQYGYDLELRGDAKLLVEFTLDKGQSNGGYNIIQSEDKRFFAVFWLIAGKKKDGDIYGYSVFNDEFEKINEGEYEMPFQSQYSKIETHYLANSGDFFIAVKEFQEPTQKRVFNNYLEYKAMHIYQVVPDGLEDYVVRLQGRRVEAISIDTDETNQFLITGVYGDANSEGVKGLFYLKLDYENQAVTAESYVEFQKDFIVEDWSQKEIERAEKREEKGKGSPSLYDYTIRNVHILPDGSLVGSLEQNYVLIRTYSDTRGVMTTTYTYYFNDIIAFKIGANDQFDWIQKVRKNQISTNDGGPYSSYASYIDGNSMKFIFNDSKENYDEQGKYIPNSEILTRFSKKDNVVSLTDVNIHDGSFQRTSMFTRKEMGTLAIPKMFETDYVNGEMLLYTTFRSKERYGLLKFND